MEVLNYLLVLVWSMHISFTVNGQITAPDITSFTMDLDLPGNFEGRHAILSGESFPLTLTIGLNETCSVGEMKVILTLPHYTSITPTNCKETVTGTSCSSQATVTNVCAKVPTVSDVQLSFSAGVHVEWTDNTNFSATTATVDFGRVVCNGTSETSEINITMTTELMEDACGARKPFYNFMGKLETGGGMHVLTNAEVAVLGALVEADLAATPSRIESGKNTTVTIEIKHAPHSTETAIDFKVSKFLSNNA